MPDHIPKQSGHENSVVYFNVQSLKGFTILDFVTIIVNPIVDNKNKINSIIIKKKAKFLSWLFFFCLFFISHGKADNHFDNVLLQESSI